MTALWIRTAAASLAAIAIAGCTTTGIGTGQSARGNLGATFVWRETGGTRGTMVASLTNGQVIRQYTIRFDDKFWMVLVGGRYLITDAAVQTETVSS